MYLQVNDDKKCRFEFKCSQCPVVPQAGRPKVSWSWGCREEERVLPVETDNFANHNPAVCCLLLYFAKDAGYRLEWVDNA